MRHHNEDACSDSPSPEKLRRKHLVTEMWISHRRISMTVIGVVQVSKCTSPAALKPAMPIGEGQLPLDAPIRRPMCERKRLVLYNSQVLTILHSSTMNLSFTKN